MTSSLQEIDIQTNAPQYGRCSKRSVLRVHNLNLLSFGGAQWKKGSPMLKAEKQGSNIFLCKNTIVHWAPVRSWNVLNDPTCWQAFIVNSHRCLLIQSKCQLRRFWRTFESLALTGSSRFTMVCKIWTSEKDSIRGRPLRLQQAGNQSSIDRRRCLIENAASVWAARKDLQMPDLKGGTLLNGCRNCSFHFFSSQNAKSFPSTANLVHCVGLLHSFKCSSDILKE